MAHLGKINVAALRSRKPKRKTAEQRRAAQFLELHGIVHYLLTEQRCPVIFDGKLAHVRCPGVSKEAFKRAIDKKVIANLCAMIPPKPSPNKKAEPSSQ